MFKGAHLAPGFNPDLITSLDLNLFMGTDGVVIDVLNDNHAEIDKIIVGRYCHRIPSQIYRPNIPNVSHVDPWSGMWEILNEPDLNGTDPELAAQWATNDIRWVREDTAGASIILQLPTQVHFWEYVEPFWNAIPGDVKEQIDGFSWHCYIPSLRPEDWRGYIKDRPHKWLNQNGIDKPLLLTEFGFDTVQYTQLQVADFLPSFWDIMLETGWIDSMFFYYDHYDGKNYRTLCNKTNTRLTPSGRAWRDIKGHL